MENSNNLSYLNLIEAMKNTPVNLLEKAINQIDSNQAKIRILYRSQAYIESQLDDQNYQYIAEGGDCALIELIAHELAETKSILREVLRQINPVD